jgi:hypothetical protein
MWTGRLRTTNTLSDTLKQQVKGIPELPSTASARAGLTSKSNFNHLILNKLCKQVRRGELSSLSGLICRVWTIESLYLLITAGNCKDLDMLSLAYKSNLRANDGGWR